jgi:hypothetical protein
MATLIRIAIAMYVAVSFVLVYLAVKLCWWVWHIYWSLHG